MREINNTGTPRPIHQSELKYEKQTAQENIPAQDMPQVTDFSNPKAEALGRSQVVAGNDNLKSDLAFLAKHPEVVQSAENFFNGAYAQLLKADEPNAYEKAAAMATMYAREFIK